MEKIQVLLKSDKESGYFTWRRMYICGNNLAEFFLELEIFKKKVVEKVKARMLF